MRASFQFFAFAVLACSPDPVVKAYVSGTLLTGGVCRAGLDGVRLQVVSPSLLDPSRSVVEIVTGDGGQFSFELPDGGFDLVAQTPTATMVFAGLAGNTREMRIETFERGPAQIEWAKIPVRIEEPTGRCGTPERMAPEGFDSVRATGIDFAVKRDPVSRNLIGTALRCADDDFRPLSVDFLESDVSSACAYRYKFGSGPSTWNFPAPAMIPELVVRSWDKDRSSSAGSRVRVVRPDGGDLSVRTKTRFAEEPVSVTPDGFFEVSGALIVASSANSTGLVTRTFPAPSSVAVELPDFPRVESPEPGFRKFTAGTKFVWTRTVNAFQTLTIAPEGGGRKLVVFTDKTEFEMPEPKALGISLEPVRKYRWSVFATTAAPARTVAELVRGVRFPFASELPGGGDADTLIGEREIFTP